MASKEMDRLLAEANNYFGLNLHLELAREQGNVFFSPFSVSLVLSMLFRGAKGDTAAEIKQVLGLNKPDLDDSEIHQSFHNLLSVISSENQKLYTLAVANAIVVDEGFAILPDYKTDLQKTYKAMVMEADFYNDSISAVNKVNLWAKKNTKGKIPSLVESLQKDTVVVLLNAVYFKGTWEQPFKRKNTCNGTFYNRGIQRQAQVVRFMVNTDQFWFVGKDTYSALELSYKGDQLAMLLLLPKELDGLKDFEKGLEAGFVQKIRRELRPMKVKVELPKLHVEYSKELLPFLKTLGVVKAFQLGEANLKAIGNADELIVSKVIHKALLDVTEKGSEAAVATMGALVLESSFYSRPIIKEFRADHPFSFVIFDKRNDLILFMGRVEELSADVNGQSWRSSTNFCCC